MNLHVGLDISQRKTAICVVNDKGKIVAEGNSLTLPSDIHGWLLGKPRKGTIERIVMVPDVRANMKALRIGIASYKDMKARTLEIARGKLEPSAKDPKIWFASAEGFAKALSNKNRVKRRTKAKQEGINIFADLGLSNADRRRARAHLGAQVMQILKREGYTRKEAAAVLGVRQQEVSALMSAKLSRFSEARLIGFLNRLNRKIRRKVISN
jgi:predicted XRE-type DNA-binding protein